MTLLPSQVKLLLDLVSWEYWRTCCLFLFFSVTMFSTPLTLTESPATRNRKVWPAPHNASSMSRAAGSKAGLGPWKDGCQ